MILSLTNNQSDQTECTASPHQAPWSAGKTTPWQAPMAERRQRKGAKPRSAATGESSVKNEETNMAAPTTRLKPKWSDSHPPEGVHTQIISTPFIIGFVCFGIDPASAMVQKQNTRNVYLRTDDKRCSRCINPGPKKASLAF